MIVYHSSCIATLCINNSSLTNTNKQAIHRHNYGKLKPNTNMLYITKLKIHNTHNLQNMDADVRRVEHSCTSSGINIKQDFNKNTYIIVTAGLDMGTLELGRCLKFTTDIQDAVTSIHNLIKTRYTCRSYVPRERI